VVRVRFRPTSHSSGSASSFNPDCVPVLRLMRFSDHCYAATGFAYVPPWSVNAGFVIGERETLVVDAGPSPAAAETILGYATSARPGNLLRLVNTERHLDHVIGNAVFLERGIDVYGHAAIARTVDDLGGVHAQIIFTPGHTPTNLCVFVPEDLVLFCGDCLVPGYQPNLGSGGRSERRQWLASLDRIATLAPTVAVPGDGRVLRSSEEIAAEIRRMARILGSSVDLS
jgi:glyoxylase-like metal-dependent hydrolase (beta-lactamase superfamily II)